MKVLDSHWALTFPLLRDRLLPTCRCQERNKCGQVTRSLGLESDSYSSKPAPLLLALWPWAVLRCPGPVRKGHCWGGKQLPWDKVWRELSLVIGGCCCGCYSYYHCYCKQLYGCPGSLFPWPSRTRQVRHERHGPTGQQTLLHFSQWPAPGPLPGLLPGSPRGGRLVCSPIVHSLQHVSDLGSWQRAFCWKGFNYFKH